MNEVRFIGRPTRDPVLRISNDKQTVFATFNLAVPRPKSAKQAADFPRILVFGKQAETFHKYVRQGDLIAVLGRVVTGPYTDIRGVTRVTTNFVASRIEFLNLKAWRNQKTDDIPETIDTDVEDQEFDAVLPEEEVPF